VLSYGLLREISLKKFLSACLAASRFVERAQVRCGRVRPAGKAPLNRGDEPVIRFATDVGASGRGAFNAGNQMRVAQRAHKQTSGSRMHCEKYFGAMAEQHRKHRRAERNMDESREMNRVTLARQEARSVDSLRTEGKIALR
jgi:hypothetical protein